MMASSLHSRSSSQDTASARTGSSYNLILDHILSYPGTYEIPLRTMYTLNCAPRAQPLPQLMAASSGSPISSNNSSPTSTQFPQQEARLANAQFTSSLMAQISQMPTQPCSLPPSFINSFAHRCFPYVLEQVDFPQALTALDYIKDLEQRRRRELVSAFQRLGIERHSLNTTADEFSQNYPEFASWIRDVEERERKIEALYTQLYIATRRWILINEMSLEPFNKHNCVAMLNTLYPPIISTPPTSKLTPAVLKSQRDGFFRYIRAVERNGSKVLDNLMLQGKRPGDSDGWGAVANTIDGYLRVACASIVEFGEIGTADQITGSEEKMSRRKVDSGVSFGSNKHTPRPETRDGSALTREKTNSPPVGSSSAFRSPSVASSRGSTLERIARELRRMGRRNKVDVEEIIVKSADQADSSDSPSSSQTKLSRSKSLRRMKSFGALGELRSANASTVSVANTAGHNRKASEAPSFDKHEMQRQRMLYEARNSRKESNDAS